VLCRFLWVGCTSGINLNVEKKMMLILNVVLICIYYPRHRHLQWNNEFGVFHLDKGSILSFANSPRNWRQGISAGLIYYSQFGNYHVIVKLALFMNCFTEFNSKKIQSCTLLNKSYKYPYRCPFYLLSYFVLHLK
jgi:hypothetical protein